MHRQIDRRSLVAGGLSSLAVGATLSDAVLAKTGVLRFGLTPVFLDNDMALLKRLKDFLVRQTGRSVQLIQRRTYEEITSLLVSGQLTAAWICGYPFVAHKDQLSLVAVPVWRGRPLYQSYLIVAADRPAQGVNDLENDLHAFSDPNSNSGHLVTQAILARSKRRPEEFFRKTFFTYSHRNVVRAVASGLADSGSVDGYVWEVIAEIEPKLASQTKVIARSAWLGFPPIAVKATNSGTSEVLALKSALLTMRSDPDGAEVLRLLHLDGFTKASPSLFDGIAEQIRAVRSLG